MASKTARDGTPPDTPKPPEHSAAEHAAPDSLETDRLETGRLETDRLEPGAAVIPAEGRAVPDEQLGDLSDWLAAGHGGEPVAILSARCYRDRVVAVTVDGRKIERALR